LKNNPKPIPTGKKLFDDNRLQQWEQDRITHYYAGLIDGFGFEKTAKRFDSMVERIIFEKVA